ncbi:MAG: hypothetical protein MPJ52_00545 [Alphaproteobacteria bacterium]|nr:hypothetical protein [Alphaproteobacteria bacterium]
MKHRIFIYIVARDYGFAPNPFYGFCTLATCKPFIRGCAKTEDWVVGIGSKKCDRVNHIVFAMRVTDTMTFDEYWNDPRFLSKRPHLVGSMKQAFGDNIYHHSPESPDWIQENSHHSLRDGSVNWENVRNDTQKNRVLVSEDFAYWGGSGPFIPEIFHEHLPRRQGHRSRFCEQFITDFIKWIRSREESGYLGEPLEWQKASDW